MENVNKIISQVRNISSSNDKIALIKHNKDNELLQKTLKYTYDPKLKYGVSNSVLEKIVENNYIGVSDKDIFILLDILAANNINDSLRREIGKFYNSNKEMWDLYSKMLLKDLQIGMSVKSINKSIPGLIEDFAVMKAYSYDDNMDSFNTKARKEGYIMMLKKNGIRGEIFKQNGSVIIKSRQNKIVKGLVELEESFKNMPDGFYEGEILAIGEFKTSADQFKKTDSIYSTKGIKKGLYIELFDYISIGSFENGEDKTKCIDRKTKLKEMVENNNSEFIKYAEPTYMGKDTDLIIDKLKEVTKDNKEEGLMVVLNNSPYQAKKVKHILKVKEFYTIDLLATGVVEGKKSSTKGKMGSVTVDFKGNKVDVSGWSNQEKEHYWKHPEDIIGRVIEVKYKEVTKDKNGKESLQFANRIRVREIGKEISYS